MDTFNIFLEVSHILLECLQKYALVLAATCWDSNLGVFRIPSHLNCECFSFTRKFREIECSFGVTLFEKL